MAELPITTHHLVCTPDTPNTDGFDGYRWNVALDDVVSLRVELSATQRVGVALSTEDLHARVPDALRRFAARQGLRNDLDVLEQVAGWNSPIILRSEDFA